MSDVIHFVIRCHPFFIHLPIAIQMLIVTQVSPMSPNVTRHPKCHPNVTRHLNVNRFDSHVPILFWLGLNLDIF